MLFEKAVRLKLRFDTPKGALTIEDLWDLPLTSTRNANLDDIAKDLNRKLKDDGNHSFVAETTAADEVLQLKFNVVKHVIDVRLAENAAAKAATDKKLQKERILEIIARKQDEKLAGSSLEELQGMLAAL